MKVLIAGENPFAVEIGELCERGGHDTTIFLIEDFYDAIESGYLMDQVSDIDIVIEIHNETAAAKQELLVSLSKFIPSDALILASVLPTSTTQAASWISFPNRVVGFVAMPPLIDHPLIELAAGLNTDMRYYEAAGGFWNSLGMETIQVRDGAGLLRGRMIGMMLNEAADLLMQGVASAVDIDSTFQVGSTMQLGPLAWADYIGIDAALGMMRGLSSEWQDGRFSPSPLLKHMVAAGKLGRKTGQGFFKYENSDD